MQRQVRGVRAERFRAHLATRQQCRLQGIESESLLYLLDEADVCASAASACASGAMEPSHVLAAMGLTPDLTMGALRLSLGHTTTVEDIDRAIVAITDAVTRIRAVQNRRSL